MQVPKIENLKDLHMVSGKGAYDFRYRYAVGRSRGGIWYGVVEGFVWEDNQGGIKVHTYRIAADDAQRIIKVIRRIESGANNYHNVDVADMIQEAGDNA